MGVATNFFVGAGSQVGEGPGPMVKSLTPLHPLTFGIFNGISGKIGGVTPTFQEGGGGPQPPVATLPAIHKFYTIANLSGL